MRLFIIIIFQFIILSVIGQKTERFNGEFFNGIKIKGEANYSYYTDDKNNKIKHGSFRYSAREKTDNWRYSHSISGNYINGLKDGIWSYNLASKDYEKNKDGYFFIIDVQLTATYSSGYPDGEWQYTCKISKHKKENKQGRLRNTQSVIAENIFIKLNWKKGVLIDSLIIKDQLNKNITARMNGKGLLIHNFKVVSGSETMSWFYNEGILKNNTKDSITITNNEFTAYQNLKNADEQCRKKRQSLFSQDECQIENYLNTHIFNHDYFLYRFIDGDKILKYKNKFGDFDVRYKGLYYYRLIPILNEKEIKIIKDIQVKHEKIKQAEWQVNRDILKNPSNQKYKDDKLRIAQALKIYKRLECHISYYKLYLSLETLLKDGQYRCSNLKNPEDINSKLDYLNAINETSIKQFQILQINQQL